MTTDPKRAIAECELCQQRIHSRINGKVSMTLFLWALPLVLGISSGIGSYALANTQDKIARQEFESRLQFVEKRMESMDKKLDIILKKLER